MMHKVLTEISNRYKCARRAVGGKPREQRRGRSVDFQRIFVEIRAAIHEENEEREFLIVR